MVLLVTFFLCDKWVRPPSLTENRISVVWMTFTKVFTVFADFLDLQDAASKVANEDRMMHKIRLTFRNDLHCPRGDLRLHHQDESNVGFILFADSPESFIVCDLVLEEDSNRVVISCRPHYSANKWDRGCFIQAER